MINIKLLFLSLLVSATAMAQLESKYVGFGAPFYGNKGTITYPELGAIVLDLSDSTFYGNVSSNPSTPVWAPFTITPAGPAGTILTSDGDSWIPANPVTSNIVTSTSDLMTPISGVHAQMTNNSITLTPGTWLITLRGDFTYSPTTASYTYMRVLLAAANGNNTTTPPPTIGGVIISGSPSTFLDGPTTNQASLTSTLVVSFAANTTAYAVPQANMITPANARVRTYITAVKIN